VTEVQRAVFVTVMWRSLSFLEQSTSVYVKEVGWWWW
jgi:hypothetical protein